MASVYSDPAFLALSPAAKTLVLQEQDPEFVKLSPEAKRLVLEEDSDFNALPLKSRATLYNELAYPGTKAPAPVGRVLNFEPKAPPQGTENIGLAARTRGQVMSPQESASAKEMQRVATKIMAPPARFIGKAVEAGLTPLLPETQKLINKGAAKLTAPSPDDEIMQRAVKNFIRDNAGLITSPVGLASAAISAGTKVPLANTVKAAMAGKFAKAGASALEATRAMASPEGLAVAGRGLVQNITGIPGYVPATVGGAVIPEVAKGIAKPIGGLLGKIPVGASIAAPIRRMTFPTGMDVPREASTTGQMAKEAFLPAGSSLPPELRTARQQMVADLEQAQRAAIEKGEATRALAPTPAMQTEASKILESGVFKGGKAATYKAETGAQQAAKMAVEETNRLGVELQKVGFPGKYFERFKEAYLGRYYLPQELTLKQQQRIKTLMGIKGDKPFTITSQGAKRLMKRKDLPEEVRKILGEVSGVSYRLTKTMAQEGNLLARGKFQKAIADTKGQVFDNPAPGLVQVSAGKSVIPQLANKYIPMDTARELAYFDHAANELRNLSLPKKAMGMWKTGVTALNLPVWTGNIVNNLLIADAHMIGRPELYAKAAKEFIHAGPEMELARKAGLFSEGFELRTRQQRMLAEMIGDVAKGSQTTPGMAAKLFSKANPVVNGVEKVKEFYRAQDDFFKYMAFRDGMSKGMEPMAAAIRAREMFVDFSRTPISIRKLGASPVSPAPFVSWQYGIIPSLSKAVASNPMAIARWKNALDSWNYSVAHENGIDPEVLDRIREARAMQQTDPALRALAMNAPLLLLPQPPDAQGNIKIMDVTRLNPLGYFSTGRWASLSPVITAPLEYFSGDKYYGPQRVGQIPYGEMPQELGRLAVGLPTVQTGLKVFLQQMAKTDGLGQPAEYWEKWGEKIFGTAFYGGIMSEPTTVGQQAMGMVTGTPQTTGVGREQVRAARKLGIIPSKFPEASGEMQKALESILDREMARKVWETKNRPGIAAVAGKQ